ncbi:MAG TPA: hypothetical protein VML95_02080 [Longimicrobiales bacterium]|nr:hypothetical protein [Longimicrobiales bacterium]
MNAGAESLFARLAITAFAGIAIVLHLVFPQVQLDLPTLILVLVGVAPWLAPVFKSIELPGGFKIELQHVQRATRRVVGAEPTGEPLPAPVGATGSETTRTVARPGVVVVDHESWLADLEALARQDPNLSLVALRIEIESMLRNIARGHHLEWERRSAGRLLSQLHEAGIFSGDLVAGLRDLISLGNQAAHGTEVTPEAAEWALDHAGAILGRLTGYLGD